MFLVKFFWHVFSCTFRITKYPLDQGRQLCRRSENIYFFEIFAFTLLQSHFYCVIFSRFATDSLWFIGAWRFLKWFETKCSEHSQVSTVLNISCNYYADLLFSLPIPAPILYIIFPHILLLQFYEKDRLV